MSPTTRRWALALLFSVRASQGFTKLYDSPCAAADGKLFDSVYKFWQQKGTCVADCISQHLCFSLSYSLSQHGGECSLHTLNAADSDALLNELNLLGLGYAAWKPGGRCSSATCIPAASPTYTGTANADYECWATINTTTHTNTTTTTSTTTAVPTTTAAAPTTTSSTTTVAPTTMSAQGQPKSLTTTAPYYDVLDGALTITVSNVSQFINDPNVRAPLRKAIANLSGVNETWVVIHNITLVTTRRLTNLDFGELRVRMLSSPDFSSTLSSDCTVNFHVELRQDGSTFVTAELVMSRINNVAFTEASQVVNAYLDAGLFGGNKYNVQVQYAVVKLKPQSTGTVPPVSPSPAPPSSNGLAIFICILVVCIAIIVASGLGAYWRLVSYRRYQRSKKIRSCSRNPSTLWDKTAAELLHPPRSITDGRRSACFVFLRSMLDPRQGSDRDVYITFAVGKREQDVQLSGPGLYHAAAITKALYDRGVLCQMSAPGLNDDVSFEVAYQQSIHCKLLLVLETDALYRCMKSLQEIEAAVANNIRVMRVRIEAVLPKESEQWPDVCASGDMLSFRNLYNLISPWSEKSLLDHGLYIDHCADDVKMKLVLLTSSKLDFTITKQKSISPGKTLVHQRFNSDCFQQKREQEPEQDPLPDNNASSVSGPPASNFVADAAVKLDGDVAKAKSMPARLDDDIGSETVNRATRLCKHRARPKTDLPLSDPKIQDTTTVAGVSSKPLKTESRKRQPANIAQLSRQKSGSRKNNAARCACAEGVSTERATKTPSVVKGENNTSVVKKQHRSNVGRKKEQEPTMSVDTGDGKANKPNQSDTMASTRVTTDTDVWLSRSSPTGKAKVPLQGPTPLTKRNKGSTSPARRRKCQKTVTT